MEILPSKFRSPPPKPPRRRHSDQLAITSSGTYPSSRKKHQDENKVNIKNVQLQTGDVLSGCGSLPANWVADFTTDKKSVNPVFKTSYSSGCLNQSFQNVELPISSDSDICNDSFTDGDGTYCKIDSNLGRTIKSENTNFEQINTSIFPTKLLETSNCKNMENSSDQLFSKIFTTDSKESYRRHHSDPVLQYNGNSFMNDDIVKEALRNSFEETSLSAGNKRSSDSSTTSSVYKETQHLYEEIKNLKEINNKLWQHLCLSQSSLEDLRKNSEHSCEMSLSDLLSSLYYLQRAKDAAMEDRMQSIIEERDTAVQDLEDMIQIIARSFENDTIQEEKNSEEIRLLLKEIEDTHNPSKLIHQQRLLLTHLYRSKELRQDQLVHQLKLTTSDRDNLLEKVKHLEEEIKCLKLSNDVWNADNKLWENNLLNVICQVIQQRDVALSHVNVIKNVEGINCRSSVEENAIDVEQLAKGYEYLQRCDDKKFNAMKRKFETSHLEAKKCDLFCKDSTPDELALLKGEIAVLGKALEMEVEKREFAEDKCLRLERLVTVLQKKVNGQNVGIHV